MAIDRFVPRPQTPSAESGLPDAPQPRSLLDIFSATVVSHGPRLAVDALDGALSYRDLAYAAGDLAESLGALGVGPGDRVGVRVPSGTSELYVAILGVLSAGAAYVPVDADDPPARAEQIWHTAEVCAVIGDGLQITAHAPAVGGGNPVGPEDDAWVIFTSGSTGTPKGVAVSHRAAAAFVDAEAELWNVGSDDRVLAGLSVGFDASCEEMWLAWRNGAALVPAPRSLVRSGAELGPWLAERGVTVISTVPTLAAMWDEATMTSVRLLILGGEACPEELGWRLAAGREVWNTYGPTEATVVSTAAPVRVGEPITIGLPLRGWRVAVVDRLGEPAPFGQPGELVIGGVGLGRYLDPALDAERFAGLAGLGWERAYRSGDIVRETVSGLEFVGRHDDQVKIGGRRLELGEIDAQLGAVPGVTAAASAIRHTASGNKVLVGYIVGPAEPAAVRDQLTERLPQGIVPVIISLDNFPLTAAGKIDRRALPWPAPAAPDAADRGDLSPTAAWLADQWADQLGPLPICGDSDFFTLGGSSLAAAKLVTALRTRYPSAAVADVYNHRLLNELADRLDHLAGTTTSAPVTSMKGRRRWGAMQLVGVCLLFVLRSVSWVLGILAFNNLDGIGPRIGWGWLIASWLIFASPPGRMAIVLVARRVLIGDLRPGRYSRYSWLAWRLWFVERITGLFHLTRFSGTPWATRIARMSGIEVGSDARLGTLPPPTALIRIGEWATIEAEVDLAGWWVEGNELVVDELEIGARARIGARTVLMPGARVGAGAEVEPGSVVTGEVPAGEHWAGSPARHIGEAGASWPTRRPVPARRRRVWQAMFGVGMGLLNLIPLIAALPAFLVLDALGADWGSVSGLLVAMVLGAPLVVAGFLAGYALVAAGLYRSISWLVRPGWHPDESATGWAIWFTEQILGGTRGVLFPLYATVYTRYWLRLLGLRVGRRTEVSVAEGVSRLLTLGETSFVTDAALFSTSRAREGWLHVDPISVGNGSFIGNGAVLNSGTRLGDDSLVGVLSSPPKQSADGTSWLGAPPLELPRKADRLDPARTTDPPRQLVIARGITELVRIMLPSTLAMVLGAMVFFALESIGESVGWEGMLILATPVLMVAGIVAVGLTVMIKWLIIGRYRSGDHPLWSFFVWRDEILNSTQEQLANAWLISVALSTPLMRPYLRAMGAKVGKGVWCETLATTEFDLVTLEDGCAVNRGSVVQTHLFQDRLLRLGPARMAAGSTLGPASVTLPDTTIGAGATVGARSVVLRGEELPAGTRWHGAPVVSA